MKYKYLGNTGVQVSALSFGAMTFGKEANEETALALYQKCREAGINLFDAADVYQSGAAEEMLGRFAQNERKDLLLTSKVYFPFDKGVNAKGLSRRHIHQSIEGSLKRLKTDYLDIYFMHRFDEHTPLEESIRAMHDLVAQGKVLYLGLSNFAAWQMMKAIGLSAKHDWSPFSVIQPMYNLVKRQAEVEILPMALAENLGVMSYNPLAGGLLSGKYAAPSADGMRFKERAMYQVRYQSYHEMANQFAAFAKSRGFSPVSLAIAWAASHPAVTSPILGARNVVQLTECLQALEIEMTPELREEIARFTPAPPLATDRSDELVMAHT